ncbi:hypothetical protein TWF694_010340 [Orbilia ellipsospora]|uniref:Uncharacterized protein n=1 Tax=Orbilia ellipsospora TaxID=2528407 RepID=A0AAV9X9X4_9PEZI
MHFFKTAIGAGIAVLAVPALARTAQEIVSDIKALTERTSTIKGSASQLTTVSVIQWHRNDGALKTTTDGYNTIIEMIARDIKYLADKKTITTDDDAKSISAAFNDFNNAQGTLTSVMKNKSDIKNAFPPLGKQMGDMMRGFQKAYEGYVIALSNYDASPSKGMNKALYKDKAALSPQLALVSGTWG